MGGSTHIVQFNLSEFYRNISRFRLRLVLVLQQLVTNFQSHSLLESASNLVVFGDSLSDMGNGNNSAIVSCIFFSSILER